MLLIFDCDGVILDSMKLHSEVESEIYSSYGIPVTPKDIEDRFAGISQPEVSKILEQEFGRKVPDDVLSQIQKKKVAVFSDQLQAIPYIAETIERLKDHPRCIASGSGIESLKRTLSLVNLYELFAPHVFSFQMVSRGKPAPDLFLYAAQKMGYAPDKCLVIEDSVAGIQAAKAAHMRAFGFVGGSHCDEDHGSRLKSAGAEIIFQDMRVLPPLIDQLK